MGSPYFHSLGPVTRSTPATKEEAARRRLTHSQLKASIRRQRDLHRERQVRDAHFPYTGD